MIYADEYTHILIHSPKQHGDLIYLRKEVMLKINERIILIFYSPKE
jgi:hypothetical protein